jgi:amidophosphoribosyltransferase
MSELGKFIAFQAAVSLIQDHGYRGLLKEVAEQCKEALNTEVSKPVNHVKRVYENFSVDQISERVAELVAPESLKEKTKVEILYQSVENLHEALPDHPGDWYFTGDYPTPGGYRVAHKAFLNFYENKDGRSY